MNNFVLLCVTWKFNKAFEGLGPSSLTEGAKANTREHNAAKNHNLSGSGKMRGTSNT